MFTTFALLFAAGRGFRLPLLYALTWRNNLTLSVSLLVLLSCVLGAVLPDLLLRRA